MDIRYHIKCRGEEAFAEGPSDAIRIAVILANMMQQTCHVYDVKTNHSKPCLSIAKDMRMVGKVWTVKGSGL